MTENKADELLIGAHFSSAGGVHKALLRAKECEATTLQLFTANQKQWHGKPISKEELTLWHETLKTTQLKQIMCHDSYLINLGSNKPEVLEKSKNAFKREIERCLALNLAFLNFHPGAATGDSEGNCLDRIVKSLLETEPLLKGSSLRLLIETTAGQGTVVGDHFEHLAYIIKKVETNIPIGVCIDTCHIFAAGYDIRNEKAWTSTLKEFEQIVGLKHLYALHVNDSMHPLGSRKDRHASLGKGHIGIEGFQAMMQINTLKTIPKYLETPNGDIMWKNEIAMLRKFATQ